MVPSRPGVEGRPLSFTLEPVAAAPYAWRLVPGEPVQGRWIVLSYRGGAVARPLRALLRMVRADGRRDAFVLPGPVAGFAHWLGYVPEDCSEIQLGADARSGFALERLGLRDNPSLFAEALRKRPLRAVAALFNHLRGDERRFRDILRGTCGVTPRGRYAQWQSERAGPPLRPATDSAMPVHLILTADPAEDAAVEATLLSLRAQTHGAWRLTIAWSEAGHRLQIQEDRVHQQDWPAPGRVGDLVSGGGPFGVLRPGDTFTDDALARLAQALSDPAAPELVYGDEVTAGATPVPRLKPDWSPDLALAQAYPGAPVLYAGALRDRLAAEPLGAAADLRLDVMLAATSGVAPARVAHVPRVLCHAAAPAQDAAERHAAGLTRHLARIGSPARVETDPSGFDLLWPLPAPAPLATVVIPSRDRLDLIRRAADDVLNGTDYPALELVIVDNGSTDPDVRAHYATLQTDPRVRIVDWPGAFNFSAMINAGVAAARGSVVVLLNNDIAVLREDWLGAMVRQACRPEVGAVGAKLLYADGTLQHAGVVVGLGGRAGHILRRRPADSPGHLGQMRVAHEVSAVTAACLAVEKRKLAAVGGLDAEAFPVDFNDVDLCLRLDAAGYRTIWTPHAVLAHLESTSRGPAVGPARKRFEAEADRFVARWHDIIRHDPFYHPGLSLTTFGEDLE